MIYPCRDHYLFNVPSYYVINPPTLAEKSALCSDDVFWGSLSITSDHSISKPQPSNQFPDRQYQAPPYNFSCLKSRFTWICRNWHEKSGTQLGWSNLHIIKPYRDFKFIAAPSKKCNNDDYSKQMDSHRSHMLLHLFIYLFIYWCSIILLSRSGH